SRVEGAGGTTGFDQPPGFEAPGGRVVHLSGSDQPAPCAPRPSRGSSRSGRPVPSYSTRGGISDLALHQAVPFQRTKGLRQVLGADPADQREELAETAFPLLQG